MAIVTATTGTTHQIKAAKALEDAWRDPVLLKACEKWIMALL